MANTKTTYRRSKYHYERVPKIVDRFRIDRTSARGETGRAQGLGAVIHDESSERKTTTVGAVLAIAEETGHIPGQIAIAWMATKGTLPIIGPRTPEQMADNLASADVQLTALKYQTCCVKQNSRFLLHG